MATSRPKHFQTEWSVTPRNCEGFRCAVPVVALLLVAVLAREIAAQPLPRPATPVRNRRIDQKLAPLLAPIPLDVSAQDIYPLQRLRERGTVVEDREPLTEVLDRLSRQFGVTIVLDTKALDEASVTPDLPISCYDSNVPLKILLDRICRPLELAWLLDGGVIEVTTAEKAKTQLRTVLYPVQDLMNAALRDEGVSDLIDSIEEQVEPGSWVNEGGPCRVEPISSLGVLAISQTSENHQSVFEYLAALRRRSSREVDWEAARIAAIESIIGNPKTTKTPEVRMSLTDVELRLEQQLDQTVTFAFEEVPLNELVRTLRQKFQLSITMDTKALEEASVTPDQPMSISVRNVSLRRALALVLQPLELTYLLQNDQIVITTAEKACVMGETRLYPVADLVTHRDDPSSADYDTLITLLYEVVSPDSWEEAGGPGRILVDHVSRSLTIHNTSYVLDDVKELLAALRIAKHRFEAWRQPTAGKSLSRTSRVRQSSIRATSLPTRSRTSRRSVAPYRVVGDTVVIAAEEIETTLNTVAHPIHDLVAGDKEPNYSSLAEYVTQLASPDTWEETGGSARMALSPKTGALVAYQTAEVHRQIQHVLTMLRRAKAISASQVEIANDSPQTTSLVSKRFAAPSRPRRDPQRGGMGGGGFFAIDEELALDGGNAKPPAAGKPTTERRAAEEPNR